MTHPGQPSGTVGERIRGLLSERGMSQRKLAAALAGAGATPRNVENVRRQLSSWVNDEHVPSRENAEALAKQLDAPVEWFTDERGIGRLSLGAALQELGAVIHDLTDQVEAEQARSEDAARIVQSLDHRLANIEALLGQLLEGQLAGSIALGELLRRQGGAGGGRRDSRSGGK